MKQLNCSEKSKVERKSARPDQPVLLWRLNMLRWHWQKPICAIDVHLHLNQQLPVAVKAACTRETTKTVKPRTESVETVPSRSAALSDRPCCSRCGRTVNDSPCLFDRRALFVTHEERMSEEMVAGHLAAVAVDVEPQQLHRAAIAARLVESLPGAIEIASLRLSG